MPISEKGLSRLLARTSLSLVGRCWLTFEDFAAELALRQEPTIASDTALICKEVKAMVIRALQGDEKFSIEERVSPRAVIR